MLQCKYTDVIMHKQCNNMYIIIVSMLSQGTYFVITSVLQCKYTDIKRYIQDNNTHFIVISVLLLVYYIVFTLYLQVNYTLCSRLQSKVLLKPLCYPCRSTPLKLSDREIMTRITNEKTKNRMKLHVS